MDVMIRESPDYNETILLTGERRRCLNLSSYNYLGFAENTGPCAEVRLCVSSCGVAVQRVRRGAVCVLCVRVTVCPRDNGCRRVMTRLERTASAWDRPTRSLEPRLCIAILKQRSRVFWARWCRPTPSDVCVAGRDV